MLKMYSAQSSSDGGSPRRWEENWSGSDFAESLKFCDNDPLKPLFDSYIERGASMLEGGCGLGQYVQYYSARCARVIGLDFAQKSLARLKRWNPELELSAGDVTTLPFLDNVFDIYYSGGVMEHFELGPERALDEARRVLSPGGVLLVSVPYYSPMRRLLRPLNSKIWKQVESASTNGRGPLCHRFWQYAYKRSEFEALLSTHGFHVLETRGYSILWGIDELPFLGRSMRNLTRGRQQGPAKHASLQADPELASRREVEQSRPSLIKRIVVQEDVAVPVVGWLVRVLRWACANMMMYVCRSTSEGVSGESNQGTALH